jgi:hypothetical protein
MQFRLLYSGQLLGAGKSDTRASLKHQIRQEFHPQLKRLWETNINLTKYRHFCAQYWAEKHPDYYREFGYPDANRVWTDEEKTLCGTHHLAEKWGRCGRGYIPLVTEDMELKCSLDVLFLRPEEPGLIVKGGDLDNRMKTLFDALRLPQNLPEAGGEKGKEGEEPIYCLLEDDRLISEIRIVTDHLLLLPHTQQFHANDVFLMIDVKLIASTQSKYKFVF